MFHHVIDVLHGRDKKKDFAPNYSAYYPFGVDVFLSPRKVHHIARFVDLPVMNYSAKLPPILVVNVQVLYLPLISVVPMLGLIPLCVLTNCSILLMSWFQPLNSAKSFFCQYW